MPSISASAPGKIILFGEHAVVYGHPALAVPVTQVRARAAVSADLRAPSGKVHLIAPDIGIDADLDALPTEDPLASAVRGVFRQLNAAHPPAMTIRVGSTIPLAAGLGSGAAISVAIIRAVSGFLGRPLPDEQVSALAYEVERFYHGTPSGIDNTVITYARPVYFVRGQPIETLKVPRPFTIVIGDSGVQSRTSVAVGHVRDLWQAEPERMAAIFETVGHIAREARQAVEAGQVDRLGPMMDRNHALLHQMEVSTPLLDRLVEAARAAGAQGAKLSGGGGGGNMIALASPQAAPAIAQALLDAGAARTLITEVRQPDTTSSV